MLYIVITLLLGFGAVNTGNNLLYLLVSALLGFMVVSGFLGRANLRALEVCVDLPDEIYDGVETLITLRVRNGRRRLPAFLLRAELRGEALALRTVEGGTQKEGGLRVAFRGRGRQRLAPVRIGSIFPVNFFVRSFAPPLEREIVVFPAPRRAAAPGGGASVRGGGMREHGRGEEGDLRRIAEYTGTEPLKQIHWKLSARHGEFKIKEMGGTAREPVVLDLGALPGRDLEERLQSAVWLVNDLIRRERPVGLRLGERLIPPASSGGHRMRLLRELALYDPA